MDPGRNGIFFSMVLPLINPTTQEIYMTVPDKYVTLSNGVLKESQKESNG
jgi:aminopeptidase N